MLERSVFRVAMSTPCKSSCILAPATAPQMSRRRAAHPPIDLYFVSENDCHRLLQGRIFLNTGPSPTPLTHVRSGNILAGHYTLAELGATPETLLRDLVDGRAQFPFCIGRVTIVLESCGLSNVSKIARAFPFAAQGR